MKKWNGFSKMWFLVLLLVTFLAGCAGKDAAPAKGITALSLDGVAGTINETAKTISVTVPYSTDVKTLVATFTTTGTGVKVGTVVQTSGTTANDFTSPEAYTVTATDNSTATYNVTVTIAPNSAKGITAYSLAGTAGIINETDKVIPLTVPFGTDVTKLAATFATTGESVKVGALEQASGTTVNDFTNPLAYIVTAADGKTATYTVTVTIATNPAKDITAYSFVGFTGFAGTINEPANTIAVNLPFGTDVTKLIATFSTTGTGVKAGTASLPQTSGTTVNDFTNPLAYIVTAADGKTATYTVTVTIATNPAKAITAYSFVGFTGATVTIGEATTPKTISVTVPYGTDVTNQVATFTSTGSVVKVGTTVQTSTATSNNFTNPLAYLVTAADGTTATYNVTVTIAKNPAKAITAYSFVGFTGYPGTVSESAHAIAVNLPYGTDITKLVANFSTTGTSVTIGAVVQTSGAGSTNDFTSPVAYTVIAADGSTTPVPYTVTVTLASASDKKITAYSFVGFTGYPGTVDEALKTIAVTLPLGTDVTKLVANFSTSGTSVTIGAAAQTSGAGPTNDFTNPVVYTVIASDSTTAAYTVTVTFATANPTAPSLGETARFVILASQAVTTTGTTAISNGDIGIMDQARSYYEGFTTGVGPGQFTELTNGLSYAHDDMPPFLIPSPYASTIAFINQVRTDLGNADTFLAADPNPSAPTQVCPIELGTLILTRGVYKTSANVGITTGPLHVDAQGDPNAVFIFSIGGTLTTGASGSIVLDNGAQAKNIYFRTAGITTIAAGTTFYGNVFATTQVNVLAGANVTGRLFAVTDRVTLIADAVTKAP